MNGPTLVNFQLSEIADRKDRRAKARLLAQTSQPKQIIILDTNTLFTLRKEDIFNPEAMAIIAECRRYTSLRVLIPRVSFLERLFQKKHDTVTRFTNVQRELDSLSNLVNYGLKDYDGPTDLRRHLYRKALKWCEDHSVTIVRTPVWSINWNSIIRDSIWRHAPFSPYDADSKKRTEKGFRDAMILQTVNSIVAEKTEPQIAFICNDDLLRETAKAKNAGSPNFSVHPSLTEFVSALKLASEQVSRFLADVLITKAPAVFYDPLNSECIYTDYDLPKRISQDYSFNMNYLYWTINDLREYLKTSKASTEEKIKVGKTSFTMIDESGRYCWQTGLSFVRGFKAGEDDSEVMRGALFGVSWSCKFSEDGTPTDPQLNEIFPKGSLVESLPLKGMTSYSIERETDLMLERLKSDGGIYDPIEDQATDSASSLDDTI